MKNLFVPYELAVKLKDKGFNKYCLAGFYENIFRSPDFTYSEHLNSFHPEYISNDFKGEVACPLWQQVIDWLREEKKLHLLISETNTGSWHVYVKKIGKSDEYALTSAIGPNYYSAVRLSIEKVLELI